MINAIRRGISAAEQPFEIAVMSFGGFFQNDDPGIFADKLDELLGDTLIVAAAGNQHTCRPYFPAALPGVIAVGGLAADGQAWFSNFGGWVDACAPAIDVVSTFFEDFTEKIDGVEIAGTRAGRGGVGRASPRRRSPRRSPRRCISTSMPPPTTSSQPTRRGAACRRTSDCAVPISVSSSTSEPDTMSDDSPDGLSSLTARRLEPVLAAEHEVEQAGHRHHDDGGGDHPPSLTRAGVRHVHAVVAGDQRRERR